MYSQARQDDFVIHMMNGKVGEYLEIGASHPIDISNTYALEQLGWTGLSIDISNECEQIWKEKRKNPLVIADALTFIYPAKKRIDYLQIDVDPSEVSYKALQQVLKSKTRFSIITYETDAYMDKRFILPSRELLLNQGYTLIAPDVLCGFGPFEDWYIDESVIDAELFKTFNR
jgi:hypothetical protein